MTEFGEPNLKSEPPADGQTYLTWCELFGYQLTSWQTYESLHEEDDDGNKKVITGFTSDNCFPTVWDHPTPDAWWVLPKV